jgi:anthranilate phosphoribosyltransferase
MAEVLHSLGSSSAWLTHGQDGMDEITTVTASDVVAIRDDEIIRFVISPEEAGLDFASPEELRGGDAITNAEEIKKLLAGEKGAYRDIVGLNAAAALVVAGKAADLRQGVSTAFENLDNGAANGVLQKLIDMTNRVSG